MGLSDIASNPQGAEYESRSAANARRMTVLKRRIRWRATSACGKFGGIRRRVNRRPMPPSGICGKLWRGFDEGQSTEGNAGFHKAIAVMGDVGRRLPVKIPQVA